MNSDMYETAEPQDSKSKVKRPKMVIAIVILSFIGAILSLLGHIAILSGFYEQYATAEQFEKIENLDAFHYISGILVGVITL